MNVEQELGIAGVLFHGDRLGKVAGLVDGAVLMNANARNLLFHLEREIP